LRANTGREGGGGARAVEGGAISWCGWEQWIQAEGEELTEELASSDKASSSVLDFLARLAQDPALAALVFTFLFLPRRIIAEVYCYKLADLS
jgi:hypothetical protein